MSCLWDDALVLLSLLLLILGLPLGVSAQAGAPTATATWDQLAVYEVATVTYEAETFDLTVTFSEEVEGFEEADVGILQEAATIETFPAQSRGTVFVLTIRPDPSAERIFFLLDKGVVTSVVTGLRNESDVILAVVPLSPPSPSLTEREALEALYDATGGPKWKHNTNWKKTENLDDWYGVTTEGRNVTQLYLSNNNLSGSIPPELGDLGLLQHLYLHGNNLSGSIPPELANLGVDLYDPDVSPDDGTKALKFHGNTALSGPLPTDFPSKLFNLEEVQIQNTKVTVPTEPAFTTWLETITLTEGQGSSAGAVDLALGDADPRGLWSDGETVWVLGSDAMLYAYEWATGRRQGGREIDVALPGVAPHGLWSNGETMWVVYDGLCTHDQEEKGVPYDLATGKRVGALKFDLTPGNPDPRGLWSDGMTLWVTDVDINKRPVYAYTWDGSRDKEKEIELMATNDHPYGLWSDGTTMWVADSQDAMLYAYELASPSERDPDKDMVLAPTNLAPYGLWSDGTTWLVTDSLDGKLYRYGSPFEGGGTGTGGGGGGGNQDRHGDTPGQATLVPLGPSAPWPSSTPGQINSATDVDYFTLTVPQAGILVVGTTGATDTVGTVWQDGVELATADSGGARRNFRLSVRVEAGEVVIAVAGRTGAYTLETRLVVGYLENPGADSFQSGIGVISGWVCAAEAVEIEIATEQGEVERYVAAYGTERLGTELICGDTDNGFGLLFNWNRLRDGEHTVTAFVDEEELGRATVQVTALGAEFVQGVEGECVVEDFPTVGETVVLEWQQSIQNFVITGVE